MTTSLHPALEAVTEAIAVRSAQTRREWLEGIGIERRGKHRHELSPSNFAHGIAALDSTGKVRLRQVEPVNVGIVTAYNDMLSAHQPYEGYPAIIRDAVAGEGGVAQVAGGVPAMCDGITQGRAGMELSLMSRDVIAMSTSVALSHDMFDAIVCLGICDKIVPGLLMGALAFAHLPCVFIPAGPMASGLSNREKRSVRQAFAAGRATEEELKDAESAAYHGAGTCTFYGTANSNQMLMEFMGLHLPGASFVNPHDPLREALTRAASRQALSLVRRGEGALKDVVTVKSIVNGIVGLHATGGSTNHTLHLVAIARACGLHITWDDFQALSEVVPLLCRVYPNGQADVNELAKLGGMPFIIRELLGAGLLHEDVQTVMGRGLSAHAQVPVLRDGEVHYVVPPEASADDTVLRGAEAPFAETGGLRVLDGNLGRAVIKVSSVSFEHSVVEAPARVFSSQEETRQAFESGQLDCDVVVVVRFQGPVANGMPELHKLTPMLAEIQDRGYAVALVTDGRMSGASGKVCAAIHVTPEAASGGLLAKLRDGDRLRVDAVARRLELVGDLEEVARRIAVAAPKGNDRGTGRELFASLRRQMSSAESGASILFETRPRDVEHPRASEGEGGEDG